MAYWSKIKCILDNKKEDHICSGIHARSLANFPHHIDCHKYLMHSGDKENDIDFYLKLIVCENMKEM